MESSLLLFCCCCNRHSYVERNEKINEDTHIYSTEKCDNILICCILSNYLSYLTNIALFLSRIETTIQLCVRKLLLAPAGEKLSVYHDWDSHLLMFMMLHEAGNDKWRMTTIFVQLNWR